MSKRRGIEIEYSDKKIRLNFPIIVFLLMPFFKPSSFNYIAPTLDTIFNIWIIVAAISISLLYLINGAFSSYMFAVIIFEVVLALSTIINSGYMQGLIFSVAKTILICMLIEIGIMQVPKDLFKVFIYVLGVGCAVNNVTILAFPNGMYKTSEQYTNTIAWHYTRNFFWGYDNTHILYLLPFLCTALIYAGHKKISRKMQLAIVVFFSATVYVTQSAATMVSVTIFILLFIAYEFFPQIMSFKFGTYIFGVFAAFIAIVFFRLHYLLQPIIEGILKKNLTLSGRLTVWDRTLSLVLENPLIGSGRISRSRQYLMIGAPHPHDFFLRILFESGIVGFICFLVILLLVGKSMNKLSHNRDCQLLSLTLFCFFIVLLTESFDDLTSLFGLLTMAYHIQPLTEGLENADIRKSRYRFVFGRKSYLIKLK